MVVGGLAEQAAAQGVIGGIVASGLIRTDLIGAVDGAFLLVELVEHPLSHGDARLVLGHAPGQVDLARGGVEPEAGPLGVVGDRQVQAHVGLQSGRAGCLSVTSSARVLNVRRTPYSGSPTGVQNKWVNSLATAASVIVPPLHGTADCVGEQAGGSAQSGSWEMRGAGVGTCIFTRPRTPISCVSPQHRSIPDALRIREGRKTPHRGHAPKSAVSRRGESVG